jgi:hypothetical protein
MTTTQHIEDCVHDLPHGPKAWASMLRRRWQKRLNESPLVGVFGAVLIGLRASKPW